MNQNEIKRFKKKNQENINEINGKLKYKIG